MKEKIKILIKTKSNLMIGSAPPPFEIGGVDQYTATTYEDLPYIPASSLKGTLRGMVHDDKTQDAIKIAKLYETYIENEMNNNWKNSKNNYDAETIRRIEERYNIDAKAEFLFGIEGFNNSPKLIINDLHLKDVPENISECFSIDTKTSIESSGDTILSNPRTYKAARSGLVFEGEILFYKFDLLGENAVNICRNYIIKKLIQFNNGVYRLGNSKSRGYGRIEVTIDDCEVS